MEYQAENCAALAQAVLFNALLPPPRPVIMCRDKATGQIHHSADHSKLAALARRTNALITFSRGRMIGFVADAYQLDAVRIRRKVKANADAHRVMFDNYYKILKDYEQETKNDPKPTGGDDA